MSHKITVKWLECVSAETEVTNNIYKEIIEGNTETINFIYKKMTELPFSKSMVGRTLYDITNKTTKDSIYNKFALGD